jgi:plasmid maintenance system killer protein
MSILWGDVESGGSSPRIPQPIGTRFRREFDHSLHLDDMQDPEELRSLPAWKVHTLTGDRKGTWSLSVTRNRRLTFRIDIAEREIYDLNLEDYH